VAFGFDHTHRCRQRRESGLEGLVPLPLTWAADALFLCGSWASCYITVFSTNISYGCNVFTYWSTLSGTRYKNGCTLYKTKIKDVDVQELYENAMLTDEWRIGYKPDQQRVIGKSRSIESGERDFDLVWLQKEDSVNIKCEHFSMLTFCHVLFLKGGSCRPLLHGWLKCTSCATMRNCIICISTYRTLYKNINK